MYKTKESLNNYKIVKLKQYLKNNKITYFVHVNDLNNKTWLRVEQQLYKLNLQYYKINNSAFKYVIKNSIFSNYEGLVKGSLCLIQEKQNKTNKISIKNILKLDKNIVLIGIKLNNKFYSTTQINNMVTLNYNKNIEILNRTFKKSLQKLYWKFKR